jgi:pimeloyl-ACP methyl ester carboxylesterase
MTDQAMTPTSLRNAIGVAHPMILVRASGTDLAVRGRGDGVPVICLHATGHGGRDYTAFVDSIIEYGFEVICVDWPGQGASPPDASLKAASAERYADLLEDLIPALCGDERPILVGNSIGGAAALSYALRRPETIQALVLCNPGGLAPLDGLAKAVIAGMVAFFSAGERRAKWFQRAFAAYYRLILPAKPAAAQRARIIAAGLETAPVLKQAWHSFSNPDADLRARAEGLKVPVLFAWAKQDQIVAWSRSRRAVEAIPNAQVQMFRGGHAAFLEDPAAFKAAFLKFVQEVLS